MARTSKPTFAFRAKLEVTELELRLTPVVWNGAEGTVPPRSGLDRLYTSDQIEARIMSVRAAYKLARSLVKEIGEGGA